MNDKRIILAEKSSCTGCGACVDACPKSCITMQREGLHYYPQIDKIQCISCQKCMKICPSINPLKKVNVDCQKYYACWHKDLIAVKSSTSGGVGTALAEHAIDNGYYVAGVVLTRDGIVKHVLATNKMEIQAFKGSKYVQSDSIGIYKKCLKAIKEGRKILFIGTPCQTEGMKRLLLENMQDNLLTCSIICHGVNSLYVWDDYRNSLEKKYKSKLRGYQFRCKSHGWQKSNGGPNLRVSYELFSGKKEDMPCWRNLFHHWFGHHYIMRRSCFKCQYRTEERHSDIVIGDFWNIEKVKEGMDTYNGVSVVITTTNRGEEFLHTNPFLLINRVDAKKSVGALRGLINYKSEDIQNKEIQRAVAFEEEYCKTNFDFMAKKYSCPTYINMFINKIKSMI